MSLEIRTTRADRAWHDFFRTAKLHWSGPLYRRLHARFEAERARDPEALGDADAAERRLRGAPDYQVFGWLERNLQRMKYAAPRGILAVVERERTRLEQALDAAAARAEARGRLVLDPALELPGYYRKVEFHQHPGGVWSDPLAGLAYEFGRRTTTPLHVDPFAVHARFAAAVPGGDWRRILDLGCGTGASTLPFAARAPDAELYGIDLAAPCLRVACLRADEAGVDVHWSQQAAEATRFPAASFDLVHSTFLLHEVPTAALARIVTEVFRLLRPGGSFASLDFHSPPGGAWGRFVHYGHARRNNEVFMRAFCETDFLAMLREAGFARAEMRPFDDGTGPVAADEVPQAWRFPWQLFVATK